MNVERDTFWVNFIGSFLTFLYWQIVVSLIRNNLGNIAYNQGLQYWAFYEKQSATMLSLKCEESVRLIIFVLFMKIYNTILTVCTICHHYMLTLRISHQFQISKRQYPHLSNQVVGSVTPQNCLKMPIFFI